MNNVFLISCIFFLFCFMSFHFNCFLLRCVKIIKILLWEFYNVRFKVISKYTSAESFVWNFIKRYSVIIIVIYIYYFKWIVFVFSRYKLLWDYIYVQLWGAYSIRAYNKGCQAENFMFNDIYLHHIPTTFLPRVENQTLPLLSDRRAEIAILMDGTLILQVNAFENI